MAEIGAPARNKPGQFVMTERKAHEAWAGLIARKPRAAMLLHHLVAQMGHQNAVVVSQKTLAKLVGCSLRTIQYAIQDLVADCWVSVVKLNGPGTVSAYVVNDRVAWGQRRDQLRLSVFSAAVVVDHDDQDEALLGHGDLRRIPSLVPGERQLPSGPGAEPPSQPALPDMEPDLPTISYASVDPETGEIVGRFSHPNFGLSLTDEQAELERRGQQRLLEY